MSKRQAGIIIVILAILILFAGLAGCARNAREEVSNSGRMNRVFDSLIMNSSTKSLIDRAFFIEIMSILSHFVLRNIA